MGRCIYSTRRTAEVSGVRGIISPMEESESSSAKRYVLNPRLTTGQDDGDGHPQKVYSMRTPAARAVADLLAIQQDLNFVSEACDLLLDLPSVDPRLHATLARALWSSALVAYARCFATGKRLGLTTDDVQRVPNGTQAVEFHGKMIDLRNKHIAHSVNPLEFIKIGVMVGSLSGDDEERVTGLATIFGAEWEPHPANVDGLRRLGVELLAAVAARIQKETPALRQAVGEQPIEAIKQWPEVVHERGPVDPGTVRR